MSNKNSNSRYGKITVLTTLIGIAICCLFNLCIDAYGIWNTPTIYGFNWSKPEKNTHQRLFKAADVEHNKPVTIILGSSRVQSSLSPSHAVFKDKQPTYNLGLTSANMYEIMRYFKHALWSQPALRTVILGLDFFAFNSFIKNQPDFIEGRLERPIILSSDFVDTTLSTDAVYASTATIKFNQKSPNHQDFDKNGFKIPKEENQSLKSRINQIDLFKFTLTSHLVNPEILKTYKLSPEKLNNLNQVVRLCEKQGIDLKVFVSPTHVTDLEAIRIAGFWKGFEQWKRELSAITPFWDFSGYNSITSEKISQEMKNYSDSHHYRKNVGNLVLKRMFAQDEKTIPNDFGIRVTHENVEQHLTNIRLDYQNWLKSNLDVVNFVRSIALDVNK